MNHYSPTIDTDLVRAVIRDHGAILSPAMRALKTDLKRVETEEADMQAETDRELARRKPALTTQKVIGLLRRAKLDISATDSRAGASEGMDVSYGDYERTYVKVAYRFTWNFGYHHGLKGAAEQKARRDLIDTNLFTTARLALTSAGLQALPQDDSNPHAAYLRVQA